MVPIMHPRFRWEIFGDSNSRRQSIGVSVALLSAADIGVQEAASLGATSEEGLCSWSSNFEPSRSEGIVADTES